MDGSNLLMKYIAVEVIYFRFMWKMMSLPRFLTWKEAMPKCGPSARRDNWEIFEQSCFRHLLHIEFLNDHKDWGRHIFFQSSYGSNSVLAEALPCLALRPRYSTAREVRSSYTAGMSWRFQFQLQYFCCSQLCLELMDLVRHIYGKTPC